MAGPSVETTWVKDARTILPLAARACRVVSSFVTSGIFTARPDRWCNEFNKENCMETRRDFLEAMLAAAGTAAAPNNEAEANSNVAWERGELPPGGAMRTGSDLGSLFPFIRSQAVDGEFPLSYLRAEFRDVTAWKQRARGTLLDLLHYAPAPCLPNAEVVERASADGYVRERVLFNVAPQVRIPAYVLIPKGLKQPAPAIVALHDHGGFYFWGKEKLVELEQTHPSLREFKEQSYAGKSVASELARRGYVVIVIDMFYWGERRILLDDDPAVWRERPADIAANRIADYNRRSVQLESLVGRTIYAAGFTWAGVMFWDDVRTVDYLATRPEVDPARIGCVGLSVGALRSCHLAALDDRIKAAVVVGWMASYPAQLKDHIVHTIGFTKLVPGLMRFLDYPDVASLAMPAALLVINGSRDTLFDLEGVRGCFSKLGACYRKAGIPDKVRTRMYEAPHEFNVEMQQEAWAWLGRWV
jgi:dienelactone hydrolase